MFATFITPQYLLSHAFTHPDGVTGTVLCRLLTGGNFAWVGAASSVFTLANIAIERYYAVMYPLGNKWKLTKRKLMASECNNVSLNYLFEETMYSRAFWFSQSNTTRAYILVELNKV